jgi:hypothetical protein
VFAGTAFVIVMVSKPRIRGHTYQKSGSLLIAFLPKLMRVLLNSNGVASLDELFYVNVAHTMT